MSILSSTSTGLKGLKIDKKSLKLVNFVIDLETDGELVVFAHSNECPFTIERTRDGKYCTTTSIYEPDYECYDKQSIKTLNKKGDSVYNTKQMYVLHFETIGDIMSMYPYFRKRYEAGRTLAQNWKLFNECRKNIKTTMKLKIL